MTAKLEHVFTKALELSPMERAELVENILASFESSAREVIDDAWASEVEYRIDQFEQGNTGTRPAQDVFKQIDNL